MTCRCLRLREGSRGAAYRNLDLVHIGRIGVDFQVHMVSGVDAGGNLNVYLVEPSETGR